MERTRAYRSDIDGLRALAVLLVVAFHAGIRGVSGGYVGVDVFFVISGYLITRLMLDEHHQSNSIDLLAFWSRRIRRIVPALVTMLAVVAVAGAFVLLPWEQRDLLNSARNAVLSIANFHFHGPSGDYFSSDIEMQPLLHTWSLGVEEQFYFVWPIVLSLLMARGRRWAVTITPLVLLGSFLASVWSVSSSPSAAFYLPWFRVWELLIGVMLAIGASTMVIRRGRTAVASLGIALIVIAAVSYDSATRFPGAAALLPTVGAALVISAGPESRVNQVLAIRPLRGIGLVSYSWYLLHWPALVLVRIATQTESVTRDVFVAVATLPLAIASWWLIESRFRTPRHRSTHDKKLVLAAGVATIIVVVIASTATMPRQLRAQPSDPVTSVVVETTTPAATDIDQTPATTPVEIDWSNHLGQLELSRIVPDLPCTDHVLPMPFDPTCRLVDGDSSLVLVGDSHAASIAPVFVDAATRHGWGLVLASQPRCPVVPEARVLVCDATYDDCTWWIRDVLNDIVNNANQVKAVVVTARSGYYFPGHRLASDTMCSAGLRTDDRMATNDEASAIWRSGLALLAATLADHDIPLVIVHDVPELERWPSDCLTRRSPTYCSVERTAAESYGRAARQAEEAVADEHPNVSIVDPFTILCDEHHCSPTHHTTIVYRDDHHLTPAGSRLLRPIIDDALAAIT
ncbi:MAG: acyltransferase [Actinobacteria bacterium]|nr:acyltransferase [Actinomycetota bacterium]